MNPNFTDGYGMVTIVRMNYSEKCYLWNPLNLMNMSKFFCFFEE